MINIRGVITMHGVIDQIIFRAGTTFAPKEKKARKKKWCQNINNCINKEKQSGF